MTQTMTQRSCRRNRVDGSERSFLWLTTALISGMLTMVLEMAALRLFAPYFGNSIYVCGNVIAVVMLSMAIGYSLGGRWADRLNDDTLLFCFLLGGGIYESVLAAAAPGLLRQLTVYGETAGSLTAALLILAPPMVVLAAVTPILTRLLAQRRGVGASAGTISGLATAGGIFGVLVTTFVLIPHAGTRTTLFLACAVSSGWGYVGLYRLLGPVGLATLAPLLLAALPASPVGNDVIFAEESPYNLVLVRKRGDQLALALNQPAGIHTIADVHNQWTGAYYDQFALGPSLVDANRLLVLGMGGGESIRAVRRVDSNIAIDAVEIDPLVVDVARRFFGVTGERDRLEIHIADARPWLLRCDRHYELVHLDLFHGGPYVPFHVLTKEFFQLVRSRMTERSLLMANVFDVGRNHELLDAAVTTLNTVFPSTFVYHGDKGNHLVFAFSWPHQIEDIRRQLRASQSAALPDCAKVVARDLVPSTISKPGRVLLDDIAPVEQLTASMMAEFRDSVPRDSTNMGILPVAAQHIPASSPPTSHDSQDTEHTRSKQKAYLGQPVTLMTSK